MLRFAASQWPQCRQHSGRAPLASKPPTRAAPVTPLCGPQRRLRTGHTANSVRARPHAAGCAGLIRSATSSAAGAGAATTWSMECCAATPRPRPPSLRCWASRSGRGGRSRPATPAPRWQSRWAARAAWTQGQAWRLLTRGQTWQQSAFRATSGRPHPGERSRWLKSWASAAGAGRAGAAAVWRGRARAGSPGRPPPSMLPSRLQPADPRFHFALCSL